jgi:stalled ribosome rescue protein Dom34
MSHTHAVIWLDHKRAQVVSFGRETSESAVVHHEGGERHLHHRRGSIGSGHAAEDPKYYEKILAAVGNTPELLVTGPANAKLEFVKHIHKKHPGLVDRLVGVETLDHPSEGELLKFARAYFKAADAMLPGGGENLSR